MGAPLAGAAEKLKDGIPPPHTFGGSRAWRVRDQRLFQRWRDLQRFYPDRESVDDQRVPWYSVNLGRSAYYSGVIHLDMSQRGLRLSITPLLRLYHPPIFIPWSEVTEWALAPFPLFGPIRFYCGRAGSLTEKRADANVVKLRVSQ